MYAAMIGLGRSDGFKAVAFISIEWNPIGYDLGHFHWKFAIVVIIELVRLTHVATSAICAVLPSHTASLAYRSSSSLFVYLWARSFQRWQALHSWHIYQSDSAVSKTLSESTEFTRFFALSQPYTSWFLLKYFSASPQTTQVHPFQTGSDCILMLGEVKVFSGQCLWKVQSI